MWNFKRGIDHGTGLDLANHYFVDGGCYDNTGGNDTTGDGSSSNPWKTINHAYVNSVNNDYIIIAPSEYVNDVYNLAVRRFIGDSNNRDVIITDGTNTGQAFNRAFTVLENITVKNYNTPFSDDSWAARDAPVNCVFIDNNSVTYKATGGSVNNFIDCIFINNDIDIISTSSGEFDNCLFFNSNIVNQTSQATKFERCFFDLNTKYVYAIKSGIVTLQNNCHVYDLTTFDNADPTNLVLNPNTIDEQGSPANWVSPSFLDLAVHFDSPLLFSDASGNIGNVYRGFSFSPDQAGFVAIVLANPDVEILNSNIQLVPSVPSGESRTMEGFSITAESINRLSTALQIGIDVKCEYVFEVRWADPGIDINTRTWKPFRLGETMTQNANGTTTGQVGYDWSDNQFINYKVAEGRLVLTQL